MDVATILYVLGVISFLFSLYVFSHDDFIFIRKNVTLEHIYNLSFLMLFVGFLGARLVFIFSHFDYKLLSPISFFLIPYFPGLSLIGGVSTCALFVKYYASYKKSLTGRIFDYISFSMLVGVMIYSLLVFFIKLIKGAAITEATIAAPVSYILLFVIFLSLFLKMHRSAELKEGSMGFFLLMSFASISFILDILGKTPKIVFFISIEGILSLIVFAASFYCLARQERWIIGK